MVNAMATSLGRGEEQTEESIFTEHLTSNTATDSTLRHWESPSLQGNTLRGSVALFIHLLILAVVEVGLPRFRTNHGFHAAQWKRTL